MKHARSTSLVAVSVVALGSVGVAGVAAATGHGTTIHGCVAQSDGALRIVKHASSCTHHEKSLTFNTRGPRGARGPAGVSSSTVAFQMYANVDAEGDLGSHVGAVSATRIAKGEYSVAFNQPIGKCAAVAQSGQAGGTDPIVPVPSAVSFSPSDPDAWDLQFVDSPTRSPLDTSFMLTVTCGSS